MSAGRYAGIEVRDTAADGGRNTDIARHAVEDGGWDIKMASFVFTWAGLSKG
jgi:hypothetical protein